MNRFNSNALAPLRVHFQRVSSRWRNSPAERLWQAWLHELRGVLPDAVRQRLEAGPKIRFLAWPLPASLPTLPARNVLLLPAEAVMTRPLSLPLIATRNLDTVLGFELDKHTPFSASELYFATRVISRDKHTAQVLLVSVLRDRLQAMLAHCQAHGVTLHGIDACDEHGQPLGVELLPREARPASGPTHAGRRWLALLLLGLTVSSMLLWLDTRQTLLADMQAAVAEQRQQVDQLQRLRSELTNTRGAAQYLAQRKAAQPTLTRMLADLTDCLGADTWLEQLEVSDSGEVVISGQSARASDLIGRVKQCHSLVDARFQGIIQPDAESGKERFSLRAQLRQEAADAPSA